MKSNHFPGLLPVLGLEINCSSDGNTNTHPGRISVLPAGWSKTSRRTRTRPGKACTSSVQARMCSPNPNQGMSGSDNEVHNTENLPPKKRKIESGGNSSPRLPFPSGPLLMNQGPESLKRVKNLDGIDNVIAHKNPIRDRKPHTCDICTRAFRSYQALGGHKSHHNSKVHHDIMPAREASTRVVGSSLVDYQWPEARPCGVEHKCMLCDRVFSKGQALGGHKRHCRRAVNGRGDEMGNGLGPGFDFDLNELPPEWVHDQKGNGDAC
ncbi:Zinc finger protein AZF2 [Striga hermonthica]|uniref:Zinc finger protein AZF2 n=1 Tax=Striga hermonthica TaxID=68872 RepID=A0A9N7NCJ7_STRHE|nr:Zinc finger protein AZF2 [Striga hermonthica]